MDTAIIGIGKGWEKVKELDCQTWGLSSLFRRYKGCTKYFDIHRPSVHKNMLEGIPAVFEDTFPFGELIYEFGPVFHSSVSWLLGYAYLLGYTKIGLYGINMEHGSEYGKQRDSLFYMLGNLSARGVEVIIPEDSGIALSKKLYGV